MLQKLCEAFEKKITLDSPVLVIGHEGKKCRSLINDVMRADKQGMNEVNLFKTTNVLLRETR